jgi:predicted transcriptional regulator of viral defense system
MGSNAPADRLAANLAARRHNVLTARQLHDAGLNRRAIAHRVARGWLTRLHRGVYLLGPQPATWTPEAAALAACGPAGVLSHTSAAALWGIHPHTDRPVHVTLRHGDRRPKGIHIHRSPLAPRDTTRREQLRLTALDRTLLDLAATLPRHDLEHALNEALVARRTTIPTLLEYLSRPDTSTRPGARTLRAILHHDHGITRSEAERRLQDLIARAGIPRPHTNVHLAGWEIDCYWPDLAVAVELDSLTAHATPRAFQNDRTKQAALNDAGIQLLRITPWETKHTPEATVARLARATTPLSR